MKETHHDYRCACGKLLFNGMILSGEVEVKCRSCKRTELIESFSGSILDKEHYVLVLSTDGLVLRFSASAPGILGYRSDELLRKNVSDVLVMLSRDFYSSLCAALRTKGPAIFLFHSLQYNSDQSMTPIVVEAQYLAHTNPTEDVMIFTVRKKNAIRLTTPLSSI